MPLNDKQIYLIKKSWNLLKAIKPSVTADLFYTKLMMNTPSLKKTFKYSLEKNSELLFTFLDDMIMHLNTLTQYKNNIQQLAVYYRQYGISPKHYPIIIDSLLFTLQHGLSNEWNPELEQAWQTGCTEIMLIMKEGITTQKT